MTRALRILAATTLLASFGAIANAAPAQPLARPHRMAISLGFGIGSVAMSSFGTFRDDTVSSLTALNPNVKLSGELGSNFQINGEIGFRYYFPYYVFAHVGFASIYNRSSVDFTLGPVQGSAVYHNLVMEVPIIVGGYVPLAGRLYVYGGVGADVFFFGRSYWDIEGQNIVGGLPDWKTDPGVGFVAVAGADFMLAESVSIGLELRGRYLQTSDLVEKDSGIPAQSVLRTQQGYQLDFSGISASIVLRLFAI